MMKKYRCYSVMSVSAMSMARLCSPRTRPIRNGQISSRGRSHRYDNPKPAAALLLKVLRSRAAATAWKNSRKGA